LVTQKKCKGIGGVEMLGRIPLEVQLIILLMIVLPFVVIIISLFLLSNKSGKMLNEFLSNNDSSGFNT
jgi:hypothetical protein